MPSWLNKILVGFFSALLVLVIYGFFDPELRDFVFAIFVRLYIWGMMSLKTFFFKASVVSVKTIAWKNIFVVGGGALLRRLGINFAKRNAVEHVGKPLADPIKHWIKVHLDMFKGQPWYMKMSETTLGLVIIGGVSYFFGILGAIYNLVFKILTGKFQTLILTFFGWFKNIFVFLWSKVGPWWDVVVITAFIELVERIPGVRRFFSKARVVKDKAKQHKDRVIKYVVEKPVEKVALKIKGHADNRIAKRRIKEAVNSGEPPIGKA